MNYSIQYKDARGLTARSEFLPFDTDDDALGYGREGASSNAIVEVWKGDDLLARLAGNEADDKIIAVLRHPPLASTLRQHGAFDVRRRTWVDAARQCAQVYDQTVYVRRSVDNAQWDLALGALLAAAVLFLTLRSVGATLVVSCVSAHSRNCAPVASRSRVK